MARLVDRPSRRLGPRLAARGRAAARRPGVAGRIRGGRPGRRRRGDDDPRPRGEPRGGGAPRRSRRRAGRSPSSTAITTATRRPETRSPACPIRDRRRWSCSTTSSRPMSRWPARARGGRVERDGLSDGADGRRRRGAATSPGAHIPDPTQAWSVPDHLRGIAISGAAGRVSAILRSRCGRATRGDEMARFGCDGPDCLRRRSRRCCALAAPAGRRRADPARQISRVDRRLLRLPHPGRHAREPRHDALPRRDRTSASRSPTWACSSATT